MRLLFASDKMHVPDDQSGSAQTTHTLVSELVRRGHQCSVMATSQPNARDMLAAFTYRLTGRRVVLEWEDVRAGYSVYRGSQWRFAERVRRHVKRIGPDVLLLDSLRQLHAVADAGIALSCPIVLMVHDVHFRTAGKELPRGLSVTVVANSPFTAGAFGEHFGVEPLVVTPAIDFDRYRTDRPDARFVTMITPRRGKGLETTMHVAASLRDQPFLLVEGWPMSSEHWRQLEVRARALGNVTLRRATDDMRSVYRDTRLLLVPSKTTVETFGRVVVEGQVSGIPAVARAVGALPWVVGSGGVVMDADAPDEDWTPAVQQLLHDDALYARMSNLALANAARPEFRLEHVVKGFESLLGRVAYRPTDPTPR
jgi:glycosyltransferase involved in cell wall biosynthesis